MDRTELRLSQDSAEPETAKSVDSYAESLPLLDSRELAIRGLASSVVLLSGETRAHNVPVRAFIAAAETATSWYPDQPVRADEVRDTFL